MTAQTFNLPDLGEGLTESEVLNWKVKVGEHVALNQIIAEVETAKAVVELPSPIAGFVQKLHASEGQVVPVGAALVTFEDEPTQQSEADDPQSPVDSEPKRTPTLVGYGAPAGSAKRPARKSRRSAASQPAQDGADHNAPPEPAAEAVRSTPPVRKLARDHGIDLHAVRGTGADGLVLRRDVQTLIDAQVADSSSHLDEPRTVSGGGEDTYVKISAMRRATAQAMVSSAFTAPHATEFLEVDVTEALRLVDKLRGLKQFRDTKVNFTALSTFLVSRLLARFPQLNSRWDEPNDRIIQFGSVNMGMAVANDRGLVVPVVRDTQNMALAPFIEKMNTLIAKARASELTPSELTGGTFSITNVGVFGVDAGTPILPPGQTGILALGQVKARPWGYQGEVVLRHTTTLALSFDHRVVDGREASEFLAAVGSVLEDPSMMNIFI